jgi:cell division protein ZapA
MTQKNESKVLIGGNVYTLSGDESEEYLQRVALYMNKKMDEVRNSENGKKLNTRLQSVLLAINIADDYFKMKTECEEQSSVEESLRNELRTLKSELTSKSETSISKEQKIGELENEITHYKKELDEYIELFEQNNM